MAVAPVAPALPIHVVSQANTPHIYAFTQAAIAQGAPTVLTYVSNRLSRTYVQRIGTAHLVTIASVPEDQELDAMGEPAYDRVTIRDVARAKVFGLGTQLAGARWNWAANYSRDEYPYASTLECGTDAYWAYVPVAEQNIQGGQLHGLYANLNDGDRFRVVLNP